MVLFIYIFVVAFFCLSLIPCIIWRFSANGGLGGEILPAYNNNHNDNDNDNDIDNCGNRNDDDNGSNHNGNGNISSSYQDYYYWNKKNKTK